MGQVRSPCVKGRKQEVKLSEGENRNKNQTAERNMVEEREKKTEGKNRNYKSGKRLLCRKRQNGKFETEGRIMN